MAKRRKSCPFLEVCPCSKCSVAKLMALEPEELDMTTTADTFVQLLEQISHICWKRVYFPQYRDSINPTTPLSMCLCGPGRFSSSILAFLKYTATRFFSPPCCWSICGRRRATPAAATDPRTLACDSSSPSRTCVCSRFPTPIDESRPVRPGGRNETDICGTVMSLTRTNSDQSIPVRSSTRCFPFCKMT